MTFDNIVSEIADRLNVRTSAGTTRIGKAVNRYNRRATASIGLQPSRRQTSVQEAMTEGATTVTFDGLEKVTRIIDDSTGEFRVLKEVTWDEIRDIEPNTTADGPTKYAVERMAADTVTIRTDWEAQDDRTLKADGYSSTGTLSGSDEPPFAESFHFILIEGPLIDEYKKLGQLDLARESERVYKEGLSDLRMFIAKSGYLKTRQGERASRLTSPVATGGSGSGSVDGATSYTQTGQIYFDRDPGAPFAVSASSTYVENLIADDVYVSVTDRLIGRDTAGAGNSEELTVGGGVEFTGSGGIQRSALTGDVVASAGSGTTAFRNGSAVSVLGRSANSTGAIADIAAGANGEVLKRTSNALAFAPVDLTADVAGDLPLSNVAQASGASLLLGRGSAGGAGDFQEITVGEGLHMSGTTLFGGRAYTTAGNGTINLSASNGPVQFVEVTGTGATTVNLYATSGLDGYMVYCKLTASSGTVTLDGNGSETIDGSTTIIFNTRMQSITLIARNGAWNIV